MVMVNVSPARLELLSRQPLQRMARDTPASHIGWVAGGGQVRQRTAAFTASILVPDVPANFASRCESLQFSTQFFASG
ncbi:hypothetical protein A5724_15195 [Mycobacterium sp. ACS1612]|nr:hypothetical protein A5724_15195 [Mycobacterium sp. ACS1612]